MKKGFTLIELLAVIVVLSLLTVIIGTGVARSAKKSKNELSSTQEKIILDAAEIYMSDHLDLLGDDGCYYLQIDELVNSGLFSNLSDLNSAFDSGDYYIMVCNNNYKSGISPYLEYKLYDFSEYMGCFQYIKNYVLIDNVAQPTYFIVNYYSNVNNNTSNSACPKDLIIPKKINNLLVYSVGGFKNKQLESVTLPDTLPIISDNAFSGNKLTNLIIPSSVTSIGDSAFYNNKLTNITIPSSVTEIGDSAFSRNSLTSVTIPSGVSSIGNYVFSNNRLSSIEIPPNITSIGRYAFSNNYLTTVIIPSSVTSIGGYAFSQNRSLSTVIINNSCDTYKTAFTSENQFGDFNIDNIEWAVPCSE